MGGKRPGGNSDLSKGFARPFVLEKISAGREERFVEGGPVTDRAGGGGRTGTEEGWTKVVEGGSCRSNGS